MPCIEAARVKVALRPSCGQKLVWQILVVAKKGGLTEWWFLGPGFQDLAYEVNSRSTLTDVWALKFCNPFPPWWTLKLLLSETHTWKTHGFGGRKRTIKAHLGNDASKSTVLFSQVNALCPS